MIKLLLFGKSVFLFALGVYSLSIPALLLQGRISGVDFLLPFEAVFLVVCSVACISWSVKTVWRIIK